jgi:CBS domain-containing protein
LKGFLIVMGEAAVTQLHTSRCRAFNQVTDASGHAQRPMRVADVACTTVVRLPGWFTVAQARRVAILKRVSHVLVEDRGQVAGAVSATVLEHAPAGDALARWCYRSSAQVAPEATVTAAEQLLHAQGASCLPVVTAGGLLVGTISVHDIALAVDGDRRGDDDDQDDRTIRAA